MDSFYGGNASVVVTSISAPNPVLRELASQCKARGLTFYVIGDVPSPADFSLEGCEFYSLERQRSTGLKLAGLLPTRHYARKNIGYLLAMRAKSGLLLETDDDNLPGPEFWDARQSLQHVRTLSGNGWTNVYAYFTEANIWPRGLPLDAIQVPPPEFDALPEVESDCPIQQGLADGNPDGVSAALSAFLLLFPHDGYLAEFCRSANCVGKRMGCVIQESGRVSGSERTQPDAGLCR